MARAAAAARTQTRGASPCTDVAVARRTCAASATGARRWRSLAGLAARRGARGCVLPPRTSGQTRSRQVQSRGFVASALGLTARLGFVVTDIEVTGRATTDRETILAALDAHYGTPILARRPDPRQGSSSKRCAWVRSAVIEQRLPGTLYVRLVERQPLAVWQHDQKQELIDRDGTVIAGADLSRFAKLPTVVGGDSARPRAHDASTRSVWQNEPETGRSRHRRGNGRRPALELVASTTRST